MLVAVAWYEQNESKVDIHQWAIINLQMALHEENDDEDYKPKL
jgi:hypothetical protein